MKNAEDKKNNKKRISPVLVIVLIICLGVFAFSAYKLIPMLTEYIEGDKEYSELSEIAEFPLPAQDSSSTETADIEQSREMLNRNFTKLREINPDIVAWITLPDTVINYPVVQGEDNSRYLHTTFDGTSNKNGCIFLDAANAADFSDANSVIYGHHMKSGSMFARLCDYKEQSFFDAHPYMYLYTPEKVYRLEIFSAYICEKTEDFGTKNFEDGETRLDYFEELRSRSLINSAVELSQEDNIVTLQTCTYEFYDARFIVHAKLVADY